MTIPENLENMRISFKPVIKAMYHHVPFAVAQVHDTVRISSGA
jgi:hypothetical protein